MRILYVAYADLSNQGAVPVHVGAIAGGLARKGHDVKILTLESSSSFELPSVEIVFLKSNSNKAMSWAKAVSTWLSENSGDFDLIYLRDFYFANPLLWAAKAAGLPVVLESNGSSRVEGLAQRGKFRYVALLDWYFFQKARLKAADQVIAVSPELTKTLFNFEKIESKYHCLPNGVDIDLYNNKADKKALRAELALPQEGILLGSIGSVLPYHLPSPTLEVVETLTNLIPNIYFLLVGGGPSEQELENIISRSKVASRFIIKGRVSPEMSAKYIRALDIAFAWSTPEASVFCWPVRLSAFAASGVPIVAPDWGVYNFFAEHGALIPAADGTAENMIRAIELLLMDNELYEKTAQNGRRLAEEELSWNSIIDKTEQVIEKALNTKRRRDGQRN